MRRHHADGRGAKRAVGNDFEILVRLRAVRDRPSDSDGIFDIDVLVTGDDHFADPIAVVQDRLHYLPRLFVVALLETDGNVRAEVHQRLDEMNILHAVETFLDEIALDQRRHAHRFDLGAFTGRNLADDRYPDRIFPMGDAFEFENQAQRAWIDVAHGLAIGAFLFHVLGWNDAFENDFGGRRHFEINSLAFDHRHRRAFQATSQGDFVNVRRDLLGRGIGDHRRGADDNRHFEWLAHAPAFLPLIGQILRRAGHPTAAIGPLDQAPIGADVALG